MSSDDEVQSKPPESEQAQTPPTEPVAPTLDPATSVPPVTSNEPVKTEEPAVVPISSEPVVDISAPEEQSIPVIQVEKESIVKTAPEPEVVELVQQNKSDDSVVQPTQSPEPIGTAEPQVEPQEKIVEKIVEVERPMTPEDKRAIFKEELAGHLSEANKAKHEHYEKHLQEIVDFIRAKATLVTNQEIEEGLKIPDSTVTDRLNDLITRGIVTRIGEGWTAKYRLTHAL